MRRIEKTVFISYRRTDEAWGLAIFGNLTHHGYDVFIDYDGIAGGQFETIIFENIRARAHFLILLTPTTLERCSDPNDLMRREIEAAIDNKRNIVPLMLAGFNFDTAAKPGQLTDKLAKITQFNALRIPEGFFTEAMERLRNKFLNESLQTILHTPSLDAQSVAKEQKGKAEKALADEHNSEQRQQKEQVQRNVAIKLPSRPPLIKIATDVDVIKFDPKTADIMKAVWSGLGVTVAIVFAVVGAGVYTYRHGHDSTKVSAQLQPPAATPTSDGAPVQPPAATPTSDGAPVQPPTSGTTGAPVPAQGLQPAPNMTFFVTSAGPGKGGDLGGLEGADAHCQRLATAVGAGDKLWRAYLSSTPNASVNVINARDRIGKGPWQNFKGEVIAQSVDDLHGPGNRLNQNTALTERGAKVAGFGMTPNWHDAITGSTAEGRAFESNLNLTCNNYTSGQYGKVMLGHIDRKGPNDSDQMRSWNASHMSRGCSQEDLISTGGNGMFYCFAQ
jgi:TIR domain